MFSKSKSETRQAKNMPNKPSIPSIISSDLTIEGNLISEGEIQIDGTVNGDIKTSTLLIGETATINGEVNAKRVRVHGTVNGQITAGSVTLAQTARVTGDVIHVDLSIEKGAFLEGHCKRISEKRLETANVSTDKPPHLPIQGTPAGKPALAGNSNTSDIKAANA